MTIRAKIYAAIVLTVIGPLATIAVALDGMARLGDRFDEVQQRAQVQALALQLKFGVTDVNGWQTAYGYDDGRSRPRFDASVAAFRGELATARRELTTPAERAQLARIETRFKSFMALDRRAYTALRAGRPERTKAIFLGPEIVNFEAMARAAEGLAAYESRQAAATQRAFDDERRNARRRLILIALGAGLAIVLLLAAANDVVRMALEGDRARRRTQ
jgi:methyl-accepting chemotaxis protein